jgi:hypothetical protein
MPQTLTRKKFHCKHQQRRAFWTHANKGAKLRLELLPNGPAVRKVHAGDNYYLCYFRFLKKQNRSSLVGFFPNEVEHFDITFWKIHQKNGWTILIPLLIGIGIIYSSILPHCQLMKLKDKKSVFKKPTTLALLSLFFKF